MPASEGSPEKPTPIKSKPNNPTDDDHHEHLNSHLSLETLARIFMPWKYKHERKYGSGNHHKTTAKISYWQLLRIVRRLAVFVAAIIYISNSIQASFAALHVLQAQDNAPMQFEPYETKLMGHWVGTTTIRQSPLFDVLQSTSPRNDTLYLESETTTSFTGCTQVPKFDKAIYSSVFLRTALGSLVRDATYNLTFLNQSTLILPVVDCSFQPLQTGDQTVVRVFYLMRKRTDPEDVNLLIISFSMQDYSIPKQNQKGPAGVASIQFFSDMRIPTVTHSIAIAIGYPFSPPKFQVYTFLGVTNEHFWRLESIPVNPIMDTPKELFTASRTGFYIKTETDQSNIKNRYWALDTDPSKVVTQWRWQGGPVLRDSWGWVHYVHIYFAIDAFFSMLVLFVVCYRNLIQGKLWVGDAFVTVSNSLFFRGAIVLITWVINDFWALMEFCLSNANVISGTQTVYVFSEIMRADLMTVYLCALSIVGYVLREKIDPGLAIYVFEIAFHYRIDIAMSFPKSKHYLSDYAIEDYMRGVLPVSSVIAKTTPMRLWTKHALDSRQALFVFLSLLPTFSSGAIIILYALIRKVYRHFFPEKLHIQKVSNYSEKVEELQAQRRNLTLFEVATGAALQKRVGVVCDYEDCLYIKGMKFASADGIYCNGYVIMNDKYLVATIDILPIFLMKLTRVRFKNVYVYEVTGSAVQQTARLVYPETMAWNDLLRLNISALS